MMIIKEIPSITTLQSIRRNSLLKTYSIPITAINISCMMILILCLWVHGQERLFMPKTVVSLFIGTVTRGDKMFYSMQIIFLLYSLLLYANLRSGIYDHLRLRKISKTAIRKNRKSFGNYWIYRDIHKKYGLGFVYGLNIAYLLTWLFNLSVVLLSVVFPVLKLVLLIFSCILCLIEIPAVIFSSVNECRAEFGSRFVLLAKTKETGKIRSSFIDLFAWIFSAVLIYLSFNGLAV